MGRDFCEFERWSGRHARGRGFWYGLLPSFGCFTIDNAVAGFVPRVHKVSEVRLIRRGLWAVPVCSVQMNVGRQWWHSLLVIGVIDGQNGVVFTILFLALVD